MCPGQPLHRLALYGSRCVTDVSRTTTAPSGHSAVLGVLLMCPGQSLHRQALYSSWCVTDVSRTVTALSDTLQF